MFINTKSRTKGFTLIELLVVIAIIGLLSAIVVGAVSSARAKGVDAAIKSDLVSLRTAAELFKEVNGTYCGADCASAAPGIQAGASGNTPTNCKNNGVGSVFDATIGVGARLDQLLIKNGESGSNKVTCALGYGANDSWAVYVDFRSVSGGWCVDSSGVSKQVSGFTQLLGGGPLGRAYCN